jgi:hypothetical protein
LVAFEEAPNEIQLVLSFAAAILLGLPEFATARKLQRMIDTAGKSD